MDPSLDSRDKAGRPLGVLSCGRQDVPTGLWGVPWAFCSRSMGSLEARESFAGREQTCPQQHLPAQDRITVAPIV